VFSTLKYALLIVLVVITWRAAELRFRSFDPCYALIGRHGEDITWWAYAVAGGILLGSLVLTMPFCRWLCPLAAVLTPFSRLGFTRIKRDAATCSGCGRCTRACPMAIPVHALTEVTAARCLSCMDCVTACATHRAGTIGWGPPKRFGRYWPHGVLIAALFAIVGSAVALVCLFPLPSFIRERGRPPARIAVARLQVKGLTCRGKATAFAGLYLWRDDLYAVPGYLKVEAWPGPGWAEVRITYDPAQADELAIKKAITEAYLDSDQTWASPFDVQGYDPLDAVAGGTAGESLSN
jgi:ferredoxin